MACTSSDFIQSFRYYAPADTHTHAVLRAHTGSKTFVLALINNR